MLYIQHNNLKRFLYILTIVLSCTILLVGALFMLVRNSKIQTAAVQVVVQQLSRGLQADIEIGKVEYRPFNRLQITGIRLMDRQGEILLGIDTINARFDFFGFFKQRISFQQVELLHVNSNIYELPGGQMNYGFLLNAFQSDNAAAFNSTVEVNDIRLSDTRLRYNGFLITSLNASLALNHLSQDSLDAQIKQLSFREQSGFTLSNIEAHLIATPKGAYMPRLMIALPHSGFEASVVEMAFPDDKTELLSQTGIALRVNHARITPSDLSGIVPALKNMDGIVDFSCDISGRPDSLLLKGLALDYKQYQILRGNITCFGLPDIEKAYIHANLQDLRIDHALLQDVLSDLHNKPFQLSRNIRQLGVMHYKGDLAGRIDSMQLHGIFTSKLGSITTIGQLNAHNSLQNWFFKGRVYTRRFALGRILGQAKLGDITFDATIDAKMGKDIMPQARLYAKISKIAFNGYTYRNIHIDGNYAENKYEGKVTVNDPNLSASFDGLIDLTKHLPVFNATLGIHRFRAGDLHLTERYPDSDLRTRISINATGNRLDNINGYIYIDTLTFANGQKEFRMDEFRVIAQTGDSKKTQLKIQSDYLTANFSGDYTYSTLPATVMRLAAQYTPRMLSAEHRKELLSSAHQNQIEYYLYFRDLDLLFNALDLPVRISGISILKGAVNEKENTFTCQLLSPVINYSKFRVRDLTVNLDNLDEQINFSASFLNKANKTTAGQMLGDLSFRINTTARRDSLLLDFNFTNKDTVHNAGSLRTCVHFSQYASEPLIEAHISPTEILLADTTWRINESSIVYSVADTTLQVNNFRFGSATQYVYADGLASKKETDSINLDLKGISLDYILAFTDAKEVISFGGDLTGWGTVYSLFNEPKFEADLSMTNATINGSPVGDATAVARWNREAKTVDILGNIVENSDTVANVTGVVTPRQKRWDLFIAADSVNLGFINRWTEDILEDVSGRGFGDVHVYGIEKKTKVEGKALAQNGGVGVSYLGTKYFFTDTVYMDSDKIRFEHIQCRDQEGNPLLLDGVLNHNGYFKDFRFDFRIQCQHAMVLNLQQTGQDMFYGKVYATGDASIRGNELETKISANARTDRNTDFYLSIATASSVAENNFITFVNHEQPAQKDDDDDLLPLVTKRENHLVLDLQIEATPDANVTIIIDPRTGDRLRAQGSGNLKLTYDVLTEDIKLLGTYALESGLFNFTFQNVIRKDFTIRPDSRVIWSGAPENPHIDASAYYATTASLRDLFGTDYQQLNTNRTSVPVNCILYLKDELMNPTISFGLELPQSDESVASQVRSVISTDEMMMRQILYLLVFNRFYTPEYLQNTTNATGLNETYSLISSTVTGQINNWLSRLTNDFTVGFNVRSEGVGADAMQEYETQFQFQPNNRILINGNFGYRYNDISNQPLFGNLDVEYLLSANGHWRAKAYTHTVDKYSIREAQTVQGLGFMFKYDFGNVDKKKKQKKDKTATRLPTDSVAIPLDSLKTE